MKSQVNSANGSPRCLLVSSHCGTHRWQFRASYWESATCQNQERDKRATHNNPEPRHFLRPFWTLIKLKWLEPLLCSIYFSVWALLCLITFHPKEKQRLICQLTLPLSQIKLIPLLGAVSQTPSFPPAPHQICMDDRTSSLQVTDSLFNLVALFTKGVSESSTHFPNLNKCNSTTIRYTFQPTNCIEYLKRGQAGFLHSSLSAESERLSVNGVACQDDRFYFWRESSIICWCEFGWFERLQGVITLSHSLTLLVGVPACACDEMTTVTSAQTISTDTFSLWHQRSPLSYFYRNTYTYCIQWRAVTPHLRLPPGQPAHSSDRMNQLNPNTFKGSVSLKELKNRHFVLLLH